jgi:DNA-binding IclR family transcriptional regulator
LIRKAGWDSVPAVRCALIHELREAPEPLPISDLEQATGLPDKTTRRVIEDLVALKLARRTKDAGKWYVEESAIAHEYWDSERLPETSEGVYREAFPETSEAGGEVS